jgi:putative heme-binding domain-containing protein
MTGGMDNPVDVVFTASGERIISNTFIVHPGGGLRDGLLHAVYGGIYGKDHDPIHEPQHKWTGPGTMPVLAHMGGAAAPCGLESYRSRVFGAEFTGNLFACCFNTHKITRHVLSPDGSTFKSNDSDFLVSSNIDFHPTDILEDADGSLVVVDTGGWYKLCCPTSQLHKPDVLGAIYRVRRSGVGRPDDPRGVKIAWPALGNRDLAGLLGDDRPAVRERAAHALAKRGDAAVSALADFVHGGQMRAYKRAPSVKHTRGTSVDLTQNAIWALCRIEHASARAAIRFALADPALEVRQTALHAISLHRDHEAVSQLVKMLATESPPNRRVAAEALGRIGDKSAVPALLAAAASMESDRFLEHSITYALIEIADPAATAAGLAHTDPRVRRAALIALDQMDGGRLDATQVASLLESPEPAVRDAAAWIVSRHADWADTLAGYLAQRLATRDLSDADRAELRSQLARFARSSTTQQLLAATVTNGSAGTPTRSVSEGNSARRIALEAMRDSGLREMPKNWVAAVTRAMADDDIEIVRAAVAAARAMSVPKDSTAELAAALRRAAQVTGRPATIRLAALAAVPGGLPEIDDELFKFLRANLTAETAVADRSAAADICAKAKFSAAQLEALTEAFQSASPLEVDRLLAAFEQSKDSAVGAKLIAALKQSPARGALRPDAIQRAIAQCGPAVEEQAQELFAALNVNVAEQKKRLEELLASLSNGTLQPGDIRRGQAVFMGQKAACFSCHQMGYRGGNVGPDLSRIGGVRNERDLLESIVFPSASFVRSYEPIVVATKSGRIVSGTLKKDAPDEIVLAVNATETARIARDDIEELSPGIVSTMPSGLEQQLSPQDLADLIAFLKNAK